MNNQSLSTIIAATLAVVAFPTTGSAENLIANGSFEEPLLEDALAAGCTLAGSWFYCPSDAVPGWTVKWVSDAEDGNLEFQTRPTIGVTPADGVQYAELASDGRSDSRVEISQTVSSLCALDSYTLSYAHAKREGNDVLRVLANDVDISPTSPLVQVWTQYETFLEPKASSLVIAFAEVGPAGTLGSLLDNVSLTNDNDPSACPELDAKPGSNPNGVNLCAGGGVTPVAFVGNANFDPNDYTIVGVSLVSDPGEGDFVVGKGKSDACKIEDVVDDTNPAEITPDGYDDVVCHIPTADLSAATDQSDISNVVATACLTLNDGFYDITVCASDELKVAKSCDKNKRK